MSSSAILPSAPKILTPFHSHPNFLNSPASNMSIVNKSEKPHRGQDYREFVSCDELNSFVQSNLDMNMSVKTAKSRFKLLCMDYMTLLRRNGLRWVP